LKPGVVTPPTVAIVPEPKLVAVVPVPVLLSDVGLLKFHWVMVAAPALDALVIAIARSRLVREILVYNCMRQSSDVREFLCFLPTKTIMKQPGNTQADPILARISNQG
jgi:hypothetical protein